MGGRRCALLERLIPAPFSAEICDSDAFLDSGARGVSLDVRGFVGERETGFVWVPSLLTLRIVCRGGRRPRCDVAILTALSTLLCVIEGSVPFFCWCVCVDESCSDEGMDILGGSVCMLSLRSVVFLLRSRELCAEGTKRP